MATRKISDLTLLEAGSVSSSDTLLLLDNSDPTDQNKRTAVGSIFRAVPSGTYTTPGVQFELKTSTGLFSEAQGQVGLAMGDARLNLQKVGSTLNIQARDSADPNLDFTISAQGTGVIRLGSPLAITDTVFLVPNSSDNTKVARFSTAQITSGQTDVFVLPSLDAQDGADTVVTTSTTQTLSNKTLNSPVLTGTLAVQAVNISGNATIGDADSDQLTVNATAGFAAAATFSNTVVCQSTLSVTSHVTVGGHLDLGDNDNIRIGDGDDLKLYHNGTQSYINNLVGALNVESDELTLRSVTGSQNYLYADQTTGVLTLYHAGAAAITTTATGIEVTGGVTATGAVSGTTATFTGNVTSTGLVHQLDGALGINMAPTAYAFECQGDIYFEGSNLYGGGTTEFNIQKRVAGQVLSFKNQGGTAEVIINGAGNLGVGKVPGFKLDVSGNSNVDGDLSIVTTDPQTGTGGTVTARRIVLTDPQTGATATLDSTSAGGVSRGKVYFHSFN